MLALWLTVPTTVPSAAYACAVGITHAQALHDGSAIPFAEISIGTLTLRGSRLSARKESRLAHHQQSRILDVIPTLGGQQRARGKSIGAAETRQAQQKAACRRGSQGTDGHRCVLCACIARGDQLSSSRCQL